MRKFYLSLQDQARKIGIARRTLIRPAKQTQAAPLVASLEPETYFHGADARELLWVVKRFTGRTRRKKGRKTKKTRRENKRERKNEKMRVRDKDRLFLQSALWTKFSIFYQLDESIYFLSLFLHYVNEIHI